MTGRTASGRGSIKALAILSLRIVAIAVPLFLLRAPIRRFVRESLMQRVTSAHYEILCPPGALSQAAMTQFATQREALFAALDKKIGDADSNMEVSIVFDPEFPGPPADTGWQFYSVTGTTIRTRLNGQSIQLSSRADAEVLLHEAWGKPGNPQLGQWTAIWLSGDWNGAEVGMAAAQVEQKLGHQKLASALGDVGETLSGNDHTLLGAAWISEIAEFGGTDALRKLYTAKMSRPNVADVTKALGTTPLELDRKWQLYMYAYLAGMSSMSHDSNMPMNVPMNMPTTGSP